MPITKLVAVDQLKLDLHNFRTVKQRTESKALSALISIEPDRFWALAESLLNDGYHPTENIIVLASGAAGADLLVKEGNRRIAVLKLAFKYISRQGVTIPSHIEAVLNGLTEDWKKANKSVPCAIYGAGEADFVDRIVTLTHGKGEKAGRSNWNAVARARHNRDAGGASEPALDLLEKYLKEGQNLTSQQSLRWSGVFPLSVLDEAVKKLAPRLGATSTRELVRLYPTKIQKRAALESVIHDIGLENLTFTIIRDKAEDFGTIRYGLAAPLAPTPSTPTPAPQTTSPATTTAKKIVAVAVNDPRSVMRALRTFQPKGNNRDKVVTLLNEARTLKLHKHPHAFCFLLRSMFEISAKAYCDDHHSSGGPAMTKADGKDKRLVEVLRDITNHLTKNKKDVAMTKALHGAMTELAKSEGLLSVTSMNQLVHNPKFSVDETHICTLFANVFSLLEAMND
jgi:hypothetical protein